MAEKKSRNLLSEDVEFSEELINKVIDKILELGDVEVQNDFWLLIRERLINIRLTEATELTENINKEKERIQILKDSIDSFK